MQAQEGISLENQAARIRAYCQYKGFEVVAEIQDAGVSGGINRAREGFVQLLDLVESGEINIIVLYSLERLSRDMLTLLALERLLDEHDVELHTVEGQIDTSSPSGWMAFAMSAFMGEMERRQVKHRTRQAMQHKKSHGQVVGSVPYGYCRKGKDLVPDFEEQKIVRTVNHMYQAGMRLADIVRTLDSDHVTTRDGKPWTPQQVKRLIGSYQNRFKKSQTKLTAATRQFIEAIA